MSNILLVLTDKYPYGKGETFIETERQFWDKFDSVMICPILAKQSDYIREGFVCKAYERLISTRECELKPVQMINALGGAISIIDCFKEMGSKIGIRNAKTLFAMMVFTNLRYKRIIKASKKYINKYDSILIYSYWMYEPALVAVGLKKAVSKARFITRAHGYDLYEERHKNNYLPYRKLVMDTVNAIFPISEDGKHYLSNKYNGLYDNKIFVERLGTIKQFNVKEKKTDPDRVCIVSCSNMIPLKRIDRIIETFGLFTCNTDWYHFGDGELMEDLKEKAAKLSPNIHVHFMGRVPNQEVQRFYSDHYVDAFVNVSETEGVPVSIMEAQSYGIPVIATDVGGTCELVYNGENGILLNKDFSNNELYDAFCDVVRNAGKYREGAKKTWEANSNAEMIYDELFQRELCIITHNDDVNRS